MVEALGEVGSYCPLCPAPITNPKFTSARESHRDCLAQMHVVMQVHQLHQNIFEERTTCAIIPFTQAIHRTYMAEIASHIHRTWLDFCCY